MTKFIDIEKATHEYYKNPSYHQLCKVLNDAPIVNAIPIEWLKKWEGYEQGMAIVNLKDIVEYWEKENENIRG